MDKVKLIYENRNYFNYTNIKWMHTLNGTFATFYLVLYHPDIIQSTKNYLTDNKICLECNKKMPVIGTNRINGANHDDWNSRKFHKLCYKDIIKEYI